jgi:hypothetical protein
MKRYPTVTDVHALFDRIHERQAQKRAKEQAMRTYLFPNCICCKQPKAEGTTAALCDDCSMKPHAVEAVQRYEALCDEGHGMRRARVMAGLDDIDA